jgi:hypothetical protein
VELTSSFDDKLNILIAFPYFSKGVLEELKKMDRNSYRLIVDSGAFSAHNSGEEVKLDDYCAFIKFLQDQPINLEAYVQLDVIFNELETLKNYRTMLERGFEPAPVFTRGSDEKYFQELCKQGEYVFVGGVQRGLNNRAFAKWVLENSSQYKVHLLAFIKPDFINHYKPYSVDSSSWSNTSRFGMISYYDKGRINAVSKADFKDGPPKRFVEAVRRYGITDEMISCLQFNDSWTSFEYRGEPLSAPVKVKGLAQFITIVTWIYYTIQAQNNVRTKIYMAIGQHLHLNIFNSAYQFLKAKKAI